MHGLKNGWLTSNSARVGSGALRGGLCLGFLVAHLAE